ncbi:MAG: PPOX class F420-dependent oxidoreductase [Roseiflexus sp.]|nr:PPOX class F420-dependent oxidoreductase [Roseiflexus sp.]
MTTTPFAPLAGHQYMNLTTFRKNGQPVPTPVWFAQEGDRIYVVTLATSGKAKRIRANPRVQLTPSDARGKPLGEIVEAHARILDPSEQEVGHRALAKKYGVMYWMFAGFWKLRRLKPVFLEIRPAMPGIEASAS